MECNELNFFAKYKYIIGIDEAGRGPLAGPVFVCAFCCDYEDYKNLLSYKELTDSKKLNEKKREKLYSGFKHQFKYSIKSASNIEIDKLNILKATLKKMEEALNSFNEEILSNSIVLVDGNKPLNIPYPQKTIVKGDLKCKVIAAASIMAKVSRDLFMLEMDKIYPQYNFKKHKGYPTKEHKELIKKFGLSPIHRKSFKYF
ncbi:ribonuclease HII [Thermotomaculum hydrothermale]|uniref:Ribonuclease HII n=1 Tax=Thermotomaculum hydrothermale TaxID=981385 RepID=A0A7R6PF20_9BACT|nr:ribonuclease HII [Thermotomaculum hydrothermale]BBB32538.1 ribonuclease HII [Thermotomaculum hydrothermale]